MCYRWWILILILLPAGLLAQKNLPEAQVIYDTIPEDAGLLKSGRVFTFETTVDSVNTLVINEFLASNDSCYADNEGEFDDWIEIYNAGNIPTDLGGLYITDDLDDLVKWQIPDTNPIATSIAPGGYLILWADEDLDQGETHLDIKLDQEGEEIGLIEPDGTTIIDSYVFDEQTTDISEGRMPDGEDNWQFFETPTPGEANE